VAVLGGVGIAVATTYLDAGTLHVTIPGNLFLFQAGPSR